MKRNILIAAVTMLLLHACEPSQKVTASWVNPQAKTDGKKYSKIFIAAMTDRQASRVTIESEIAKVITAKGYQAVKSSEAFPPEISTLKSADRNILVQKIRDMGCDGIFTVALVDKQSETRYVPGTASYAPYGAYGGNFWGYYSYWYPTTYSPGYVTTDKTYFIEGSLFDAQSETMMWSVQTEAYNPTSIDKFSKQYADLLWKRAEKDFLNKK